MPASKFCIFHFHPHQSVSFRGRAWSRQDIDRGALPDSAKSRGLLCDDSRRSMMFPAWLEATFGTTVEDLVDI